jgi:hypothetical protein
VPTVRALAPRFAGAVLYYLSSFGTSDGLWRYRDGQAFEIWRGADGALLENAQCFAERQPRSHCVAAERKTATYTSSLMTVPNCSRLRTRFMSNPFRITRLSKRWWKPYATRSRLILNIFLCSEWRTSRQARLARI